MTPALMALDRAWLEAHPRETDNDYPDTCIHGRSIDDECLDCRRFNRAEIHRFGVDLNCVWMECKRCKFTAAFPFSRRQEDKWMSGEHLQKAAPRLTEYQRIFLLTGCCEPCIEEMAKSEPKFDQGPTEPEAF